jgi:HK97 family phage prohead protease
MNGRAKPDYNTIDFPFELKSLNDEGELEGYAAVFGNLDLGGDIIEPGAFTKTIKETDGKVPILYHHDRYEPIGVSTELVQDRKGLHVKGQLNMEVQRARETRALLNQGAMGGLSIGYKTIKKAYEGGARKLKELGLREFSTVTFPMNPLATASVKAAGDVVWDAEATVDALRSKLRVALNPPGTYTYWIRDVAADGASALVSSYDDDAEAWVVGFTVDDDGDVDPAPFSDWIEAGQVWVQKTEDDGAATLERMLAKAAAIADDIAAGRPLTTKTRAALADTQAEITALLDGTEPGDKSTPDDTDGAANDAEMPAQLMATLGALRPSHPSQENES